MKADEDGPKVERKRGGDDTEPEDEVVPESQPYAFDNLAADTDACLSAIEHLVNEYDFKKMAERTVESVVLIEVVSDAVADSVRVKLPSSALNAARRDFLACNPLVSVTGRGDRTDARPSPCAGTSTDGAGIPHDAGDPTGVLRMLLRMLMDWRDRNNGGMTPIRFGDDPMCTGVVSPLASGIASIDEAVECCTAVYVLRL